MTLSFPSSATITAPRWLVDSQAGWARAAFPIRYGVIERNDGITLIDTGYSAALFSARGGAIWAYRAMLRPKLDPDGDALAVVQRLGATAADVRNIVLTHLHADHICGLDRFPRATLHLTKQSLAMWAAKPGRNDLATGFFRGLMPPLRREKIGVIEDRPVTSLPWGGQGHDIFGDGAVVSVDLPGHMAGHVGMFFPKRETPLLYAVDADWTAPPILSGRLPNWPVRLIVHDAEAARRSSATVRAAAAWGAEIKLCHDPEPTA